MKRKAKGLVTICLSLLLIFMNVLGNGIQVNAQSNIYVINPEPEHIVLVPGETRKLKIPIRAVGGTINYPVLSVDASATPYTVSQPVLRTDGLNATLNNIFEYINQYVEMEVTVAEDAKIGSYPIKLLIDGLSYTIDGEVNVSTDLIIKTQILEEKEPAQLAINNINVDNPTIGQNMTLSFNIRNVGEIIARNVFVSVDYKDTGMIAGYSTKNIKIDDISASKEIPLSLPIKVLPTAETGIKTLTINLTYKVDDGTTTIESHDIYKFSGE